MIDISSILDIQHGCENGDFIQYVLKNLHPTVTIFNYLDSHTFTI